MTHREGVKLAAKWLRSRYKCEVVATEVVTWEREIPEAVGFRYTGKCYVVEVKTSRSDFLRDTKKRHRVGSDGVGNVRYYLAPEGVIPLDKLPAGCGLVEVVNGRCKVVRSASVMPVKSDPIREKMILVRILRGTADPVFLDRHDVYINGLKVPH